MLDEAEYKTTEQVIKEMLLENTGSHFLDSGQAFGYQYERRKTREFEKEPKKTYEAGINNIWNSDKKELVIIPTVNIYHALFDNFRYDETFTEMLKSYGDMADLGTWGEDLCTGFAEKIGARNINTYNTYNFDNFLEACVLVTEFTTGNNEDYAIISTHNGCDVRGGYSDAKVFYAGEMTDCDFTEDILRAEVYCPDECKCGYGDLCRAVFPMDSGRSLRILIQPEVMEVVENDTPVLGKLTITPDKQLYCSCGKRMEIV